MKRAIESNDRDYNEYLQDDKGHNREFITVAECISTRQFKILLVIFPLCTTFVQYYNSIQASYIKHENFTDNWFFYEVCISLLVTAYMRPQFGKLYDRNGFKRNFIGVLLCLIVWSCTVFYTWKHWESYFLYNFMFYILTGFMNTLLNASAPKIFGLYSGGRILGLLRASTFFSGLFILLMKTTLLNPHIIKKWAMFVICAFFFCICLILLYFLNSRPILKEKNLLDNFERENLI
mmetsp:Transcript_68467/g.94851  ORF Transcript_68467/g.94851 Transcript_68467/m.94851 type:complete len:235 (+) Transcript_68467:382-1086(+)